MEFKKSHYLIRIVDDEAELCKALKLMLELEDWRVETFPTAEEFLADGDTETPGCLLLDYQMPKMNGLELQKHLTEEGVNLPIVFLTAFASVDLTISAFRFGACDFLQKPIDPSELLATLEKAVSRDDEIRKAQEKESPVKLFELLTDSQKEVAKFVAQGLTCEVIGQRLGKSRRTVERHRGNLMRILKVKTPEDLRLVLETVQPA